MPHIVPSAPVPPLLLAVVFFSICRFAISQLLPKINIHTTDYIYDYVFYMCIKFSDKQAMNKRGISVLKRELKVQAITPRMVAIILNH